MKFGDHMMKSICYEHKDQGRKRVALPWTPFTLDLLPLNAVNQHQHIRRMQSKSDSRDPCRCKAQRWRVSM